MTCALPDSRLALDVPAQGIVSSDLLGRIVRVHDNPGGARIYGTARDALHAVLSVDGEYAEVALIGDDNLSRVPVRALVLATPDELTAYARAEWDRSSFVRKVPAWPNNKVSRAHPEKGQ